MNEIEKTILSKINAHLAKSTIGNCFFDSDKKLIFKDIKEVLRQGVLVFNPLFYTLQQKSGEGPDLKKEEIDYLIENSDLSFTDEHGRTALRIAILSSDFNQLSEAQYEKLVDCCPQVETDYNYNCDLIFALSPDRSNLAFSKEAWKNLIKKTAKQYFDSNEAILLTRLFIKAQKIGNEIIEVDVLADKVAIDYSKKFNFNEEILLAIATYNQIALGIKVAEDIGVENMKRYIKNIKECSKGGRRTEIFERLDKIFEVYSTKATITNEIDNSQNKKPNKLKI